MSEDQFAEEYRRFNDSKKKNKPLNDFKRINISVTLDSNHQRNVKNLPQQNNKMESITFSDARELINPNFVEHAYDYGLYKEYVQWDYINNGLYPQGEGLLSISAPRQKQEYINTLQRWLIFINEDFNGVPKFDYYPILPDINDVKHPAVEFLVSAFLEKQFCSSHTSACKIVMRLLDHIRESHKKVIRFENHDPMEIHYLQSKFLVKIGKFESPEVPRIKLLVDKGGLIAATRMLLRYEAFGNGSYQWGDPKSVHKVLYENFNVRYEGFASPVNSRFIEYNDTYFCSLFPETDKPFGSLGNFFNVDMNLHSGGWSVNPPFLNDLMKQVADRMIQILDEGCPVYFFCTFPWWEDDDGWNTLNSSKHLCKRFDLKPSHFEVQDAYGRTFSPNMLMTMFVMGQLPEHCKLINLGNILIKNHYKSLPDACPW